MSVTAPFSLAAAGFALLAALLSLRTRRETAYRKLTTALVLAAVELSAGFAAAVNEGATRASWLLAKECAFALGVGFWVWFAATYARDGVPTRNRARWLLAGIGAAPTLCVLGGGGRLLTSDYPAEPPLLEIAGLWLHGAGLIAAVAALLQLERTFAASVGTIRWRLKFMLFGAAAILATRLFSGSQVLLMRRLDPAHDGFTAGGVLVGTVLILRALRRSEGVALSVYPSQEVLRRSVTVLLAGIYLLLLGTAASTGLRLAGSVAFAPVALLSLAGLLGLAVAANSERARWRLKRFVSRHFRRPLHDARNVWLRLTAATSRCGDPATLGRAVTGLVATEFHALSVSCWLLDPRRETLDLVASTAGSGGAGTGNHSAGLPAGSIVEHFRAAPAAADLESKVGAWAEALRAANPPMFARRPHRAVVPLADHGDFIGVLVLGDRVDASPFMPGDLEILECVASQVAASLQGIRLSQSLAETRQLEAFQGMAAFFIHDLKNASFLLSLMLQNFSAHFENPAFRADALRSVSQACAHLNDLIRRLGGLREGLKIEPTETDLNEVVSAALRQVPRPGAVQFEENLASLPRIRVDRGQLRKVVTNLLLNATEAVAGEGRIRVATGAESGWAVLTVGDNGCGMSERFLNESLFRPFRTTKPSGLGIGMFQSRSIIEAHGGRITVSSRPGEGTVFRVFLRAGAAAG
jgi:putative PEP-CTERM system histidine kinase